MEIKEKDKDWGCENISKKNKHQSNDKDERKSKSRKRKKDENENHESKLYEEFQEMEIIKEVCSDVKRTRLDSEDKIRKVKTKKHKKEDFSERCHMYEIKKNTENNIPNYKQPDILKKKNKNKNYKMDKLGLEEYDQICNNYDKHQSNNEEKRKSKSRKRKKDEIENQEIGFHDEFHELRITKDVNKDVKRIRKDSEDDILNYKEHDGLKKKKKKKKYIREELNLEDHDQIFSDYEDRKYEKYKKKKRLKKIKENSNIDIDIVNENQDEEKSKMIKMGRLNDTQTDILKKKKKKKKIMKEKLNQDNSNIEIGKVSESNEEEEDNTQDEQTVSAEQSEAVNIEAESNTDNISSLYSHEYTNDPSRFKSRNVISETGKKGKSKKSTIEMYEDFIYKPPVNEENQLGEIENVPDKDSFWVKHNVKYKVKDYPQEVIQKDLLERVESIADYFDRFATDNLSEEECQAKEVFNFKGPYLPTPQHIRFFGDLEIELDWEMSEEQQVLLSFNNLKDLRESGVPYIMEAFDRSEDSILLENWQKFQEQYKFNDLRPLLAFRTMKVNHEEGCYNFESVDYINEVEKHKFCLYMARGLEERNIFQIRRRLMQLALRIRYYGISYDPIYIEPREAAEIEAFIKLFGTNYKGMEFIIGNVNFSRYKSFSQIYIKYKNMPIRFGQWQSTEKCRLVRSIFRATSANNIQELLHSKVVWKEVFLWMQTRLHYQCNKFFKNYMSRFLEIASHMSSHKTDSDNIYWTATDRVKLIMLVSENLGPTISKIDWEEVSSHFEVFGPFNCAHQFRLIYYKMVPRNKMKKDSMGEAVDYILEFIVPKIENEEIKFKEESLNLEELRSLPIKKLQPSNSSDKWSLRNTIKLIKEVYENAGSSVQTTDWDDICSHFIEYDEKDCRNHFRYLYYNRVPHQHRESFDSALEYLKNRICPMLEKKKQRNRKEFLLTEEVVKLSPEDRLILQALLNDISQADDDEDIAMLEEENYEQLDEQNSQTTYKVNHTINETERIAEINALSNYIQEKQDEDDIDGNLEDISEDKIDSYIDDFDKEENENLNLHLSTDYELEDSNFEDSDIKA